MIERNNPMPHETARAATARKKLDHAERVAHDLAAGLAELALDASEDRPGAAKALATRRGEIQAAERNVARFARGRCPCRAP